MLESKCGNPLLSEGIWALKLMSDHLPSENCQNSLQISQSGENHRKKSDYELPTLKCHVTDVICLYLLFSVQMTDRTWRYSVVMAMVSLAWLLPVIATATPFPRDLQPISVVRLDDSHLYPSFQGLMFNNETERLGLDYQRMIRIQQMLYIAARDHVFVVNLTTAVDKIIPQQILTWRSTDVSKCTVRGRNSVSISIRADLRSDEGRLIRHSWTKDDECYNYIKVLVPRNDETLFACGTNALNPACRNYRLSTLEQVGQELLGQARCGHFYSATVTDFQASDAVIYRSLGGEGRPVLRTIAVEHTGAGKVVYSRVARVCKNDSGGSTRVLDRYWTSFLKARLNCSVPGDTFFYFDVLQSLTNVLQINQRPAVVGVFTTQINSIPGSAVCGFYLDDIERVFNGRFKEQKNSDSMWTPVPEEHFPDSVLSFIKTHPLMDESVPSVNSQPLITSTTSRYKLTQIVVDTAAGPHKNRTVVFLGSEEGRVLKILTGTQANSSHDSRLLEDIDVFNPTRCSGERRVLGLELDKEHHALFVAFSSCIIRVPLSRCAQHATCKRHCLHTHDPYCIWLRTGRCADVAPGFKAGFEQDIDGDQSHPFDTCSDVMSAAGSDVNSARSQQSQEPEASLQHALSLNSLAKLNRLMDTKPDKNNLTSSQIYSSGHQPCHQPVKPHATEEEELNLPTPDLTPELPVKNLKALNSQWERSHTYNSTLQVFSTSQMLPSNDTPSENHSDDVFKHTSNPDVAIMTSSLFPSDSGSLHMPTSYYSCLKETPDTSTLQQIPLQTLPERLDAGTGSSRRHVLIKMGNGVTTARQHSFNQKSANPGNIYEIHRPQIVGSSCLTRQHSYSEPPHLQRAAIIRRTASLKPQIPPKPTNIPSKTLHLPSAAAHAKHNY
ncbi:Semaphorin-6D [Labeo rohita]|uniref:Semaphorin-6D n=1 Tax=Labeo rohita TaxID=84645 RepID=A0ABQ8LSE2_LABRO|nr:Semaphorin-6D [Labeo rohita]